MVLPEDWMPRCIEPAVGVPYFVCALVKGRSHLILVLDLSTENPNKLPILRELPECFFSKPDPEPFVAGETVRFDRSLAGDWSVERLKRAATASAA